MRFSARAQLNDWDREVFKYKRGKPVVIDPTEIESGRKITLPKLPRTGKPSAMVDLKTRNKTIIDKRPWTLGLVEAMGLVELVVKQKLDTRNRVALILLDSNFEIALKEFIVNRTDLFPPHVYNDAKIVALWAEDAKWPIRLGNGALSQGQRSYLMCLSLQEQG